MAFLLLFRTVASWEDAVVLLLLLLLEALPIFKAAAPLVFCWEDERCRWTLEGESADASVAAWGAADVAEGVLLFMDVQGTDVLVVVVLMAPLVARGIRPSDTPSLLGWENRCRDAVGVLFLELLVAGRCVGGGGGACSGAFGGLLSTREER